jgi:hypothetical protein
MNLRTIRKHDSILWATSDTARDGKGEKKATAALPLPKVAVQRRDVGNKIIKSIYLLKKSV